MGVIKSEIPEDLDKRFRSKAALRFGLRRGALSEAVVSALAKWTGSPLVHASQTPFGLSLDVKPDLVEKIVQLILRESDRSSFTVYAKTPLEYSLEGFEVIDKDTESGLAYLVGKVDLSKLNMLRNLVRNLRRLSEMRIESDDFNIIFGEEGCLSVQGLSREQERRVTKSILELHGIKVAVPQVAFEIVAWSTEHVEVVERLIKHE
jgi:hypothetical protein